MELLGQSSTFFGVLVTLIVLCVFSNSNNFIHYILNSIKDDQIKPQIDQLEIDTDFKSVTNSTEYKIFQDAIRGHGKYIIDDKNLKDALSLDLQITAELDKFKGTLTPELLKPANDALDTIIKSKEQVMAPLYSLLVGILVFICDEILGSVPSFHDEIVTFLSIFISLSFIFWAFIWISLIRDVRRSLIGYKTNKFVGGIKKIVEKCAKLNYFSGLRLLIELDIAVMLIIGFFAINPLWLRMALYLMTILFPIFAIAIHRLSNHYNIGVYSYDYLFKHFSVLFLISLTVAATFAIGIAAHSVFITEMMFSYYNYTLVKYSILTFIILNGLVMPFIMPYWGHKYVVKFAKRKIHNIEKSVGPVRDSIITKLRNFINEVIVLHQ